MEKSGFQEHLKLSHETYMFVCAFHAFKYQSLHLATLAFLFILTADSHYCTAEINNIVKQLSSNEKDDFLESPCFLHDPMNIDNLISGSSAFLNQAFNLEILGSCTAEA